MKKVILAAIFAAMAMPSMAQKFGYVNSQEVIVALPELTQVRENLKKMEEEFMLQIEEMQVEGNKKLDEYQKTRETLTESIRTIREQEINNIGQRIEEIQTRAQSDIEAKQTELMKPLIEKARAAVEAVMKAQGLAGVFEEQALVCSDNAQMPNLTKTVKEHLGIKE